MAVACVLQNKEHFFFPYSALGSCGPRVLAAFSLTLPQTPWEKKGLKIDLIGWIITVALGLRTKLKSLLMTQEAKNIKFEIGELGSP